MPISKAQKTIPELGFLNPGTLLSCPLPLSHQQAGGLTASSLTGRCRLRCYVGSSFTTAGPSNTVYSALFWLCRLLPSVLPGAGPRTRHITRPHGASCFQLAHNLGMARTIRSSCLFLAHLMKQMRGEQRTHGKAGNQGITATQQVAGIRENLMHPPLLS